MQLDGLKYIQSVVQLSHHPSSVSPPPASDNYGSTICLYESDYSRSLI